MMFSVMASGELFGLPIPDAGPVFAIALTVHILCGLIAVVSGALAATAKKQPGRHPRAGRVYLWALGGIFTTATVMALSAGVKTPTCSSSPSSPSASACTDTAPRRRHRPGWPPHHAIGMGGSYIALLTGFYVDNGPFLPLWNRLPSIAYWLLPTLVGAPLIWRALRRFARTTATDKSSRPSVSA